MRALIVSDIHANIQALDAVLAAANDGALYDVLWNLGDTVGYGGSPNEVIERVRPLASLTVRGNHDRVCCGISSALNFNPVARAAVEWTKNELTAESLGWLRGLDQGPLHPHRTAAQGARQDVLLAAGAPPSGEPAAPFASDPEFDPVPAAVACAHGSPIHEDHYIVSLRDAWIPMQEMRSPLTFIGHTHIQGGFALHADDRIREPAAYGGRGQQPAATDWRELRPHFVSRSRAERWSRKLATGDRHLINPGSVGQPRDGDWRAAFAVYDDEASEVTFHRVPYDVTAAQGRILMAGLPERLASRLRDGR